jgi:hypothetical protein
MDDEVRNHWLVSPYRKNPDYMVVRCPNHISEWSMRMSAHGRTNEMRERARRGRQMVLEPTRVFDPLPTNFRGARSDLRALGEDVGNG